ncbi:FkbM family methyltransferase [Streptomyces indicus]|uniref:Methyltransferase, FkbM family n=1 Tax=Streptomyces indicus TaxID=417292 RepID=A0A1G9D4W1_9ACTN|nr:FkbM family methyltransferase [Streptomyces indicus]SDK58996.1 methyltransferase, FkbM family [Streptomyces indicus]
MTLAARVGPLLPAPVVGRIAQLLYPRFEPELARLDDYLPQGCRTAVDIGGWYGPWSRRLAPRARDVVTVEPVPHLARTLERITPSNVRVVQAATSERPGTARLWFPEGDAGTRGLSSLIRRDIHTHGVDVTCIPVDELALHDVDFIKIDVDGSELATLRGATRTLDRDHPALLIELEARIQPTAPIVDLLTAHGYRGWVLPSASWLPLDDFDLAAHQEATSHVASAGLLRRVLPFAGPRYVNSVLFLQEGLRPRGARPGPHQRRRSPEGPPISPLPNGE